MEQHTRPNRPNRPSRTTTSVFLALAASLTACTTGRDGSAPVDSNPVAAPVASSPVLPESLPESLPGPTVPSVTTSPADDASPPPVEPPADDPPPDVEPPVADLPLAPETTDVDDPLPEGPGGSCMALGCQAPVELEPFGVHVTPAGPNELTSGGPGAGCAVDCILRGTASARDDGTTIDIEVETDTPADIALWITRSCPQGLDDGDGLRLRRADAVARTAGDLDMWMAHEATGLEQDTDYWVSVRATDEHGGTSWATGRVHTVRTAHSIIVEFVEIELLYDGDHGRNRGDLYFFANKSSGPFADREGKWGDGSTIGLDATEWSIGFADVVGPLPAMAVTAVEDDPTGIGGFCSAGTRTGSGVDPDCGTAWNTAYVDGLTWDEIDDLYRCSAFGVDEPDLADAYCRWVPTYATGQGKPEFRVLVAYLEW